MTNIRGLPFKEIWLGDFEFSAPLGEKVKPICFVGLELVSGRKIEIWEDELLRLNKAPYGIGEDSVFVAYYASAEMSCHLALGWQMPKNVLDLFIEFRAKTNGLPVTCGYGLLGALAYHGLDSIESSEKDSMRNLALRGGPWSESERMALLCYCESDVIALQRLFQKMLPDLDIPRALIRGRYMKATAKMEAVGIPVDGKMWTLLQSNWDKIKNDLIAKINADFDVFEGSSFKTKKFAEYLRKNNIPWPTLESGALALDDDTFREMVRQYPQLAPIREVRANLSKLRLNDLPIGKDRRNRCLLSAFRSRTGRNQPSNTKFLFGPSVWIRGLIQPPPSHGLAYLDWSQQEFGIAAALSGDPMMKEAYTSGDPYLAFAKQAGAVPVIATKRSHSAIRDQFKACVLAVQYGMGEHSLASRIGQPVARARELLRLHRRTYPRFWTWSDAAVDHAMLHGKLQTVFGWPIHIDGQANARSLRNFPMQANGAEMLRIACCLATENGINVCAPVHDALLIEAPLEGLQDAVKTTQEFMAEASSIVLSGFRLRSDAKLIQHPDHYQDERGVQMWDMVWQLINAEIQNTEQLQFEMETKVCTNAQGMCMGATLPVTQTHTRPALCLVDSRSSEITHG